MKLCEDVKRQDTDDILDRMNYLTGMEERNVGFNMGKTKIGFRS